MREGPSAASLAKCFRSPQQETASQSRPQDRGWSGGCRPRASEAEPTNELVTTRRLGLRHTPSDTQSRAESRDTHILFSPTRTNGAGGISPASRASHLLRRARLSLEGLLPARLGGHLCAVAVCPSYSTMCSVNRRAQPHPYVGLGQSPSTNCLAWSYRHVPGPRTLH